MSQFLDSLVGDVLGTDTLAYKLVLKQQSMAGGDLCDIAVEQGATTEEQLLEAFAKSNNLECVKKIDTTSISQDVIDLIPETTRRYYACFPLEKSGNTLTIAIVDPLNIFALDDLGLIANMKIEPKAALLSEIERAEKSMGRVVICKVSDALSVENSKEVVSLCGNCSLCNYPAVMIEKANGTIWYCSNTDCNCHKVNKLFVREETPEWVEFGKAE